MWVVLGGSRPRRAKPFGKLVVLRASGENVHFDAPMPGHLYRDVRRCPKAVQAQPLCLARSRKPQRAIAYHPSAKQRRGLLVRERFGDGVGKLFVGYLVVCVSSVDMVAGEAPVVAQVFLVAPAVIAHPIGPIQPGHTYAIPRLEPCHGRPGLLDNANNLVPWYDGQFGQRDLPFDNVQVGVAHPAHAHPNEQVVLTQLRLRQIYLRQRAFIHGPGFSQLPRLHGPSFRRWKVGTFERSNVRTLLSQNNQTKPQSGFV